MSLPHRCPTPQGRKGHEKNAQKYRLLRFCAVLRAFPGTFRSDPAVFAQATGTPASVPLAKVLSGLVFHVMNSAGTLAEHFGQLFEVELCDSSLSERRSLAVGGFSELMRLGLRTLAQPARHREAFWRVAVLALDGTQFSLTNTPQIKATMRKAKSRRGRAAFAQNHHRGVAGVGAA